MQYRCFASRKELAHVVKCYWTLDCRSDGIAQTFRFLPDGCPELAIHFGAPPINAIGGSDAQYSLPRFLLGQFRKHVDITIRQDMDCLLVKFQPWALGRLLGDSAGLITDLELDTSLLWPNPDACLQDGLGMGSPEAAIPLVEKWLMDHFAHWEPDWELVKAVQMIERTAGDLRLQALESDLAHGMRRLEQKFAEEVGISPKLFARSVRVRQAAEAICKGATKNLTQLAFDHGFFDQAHFIREFKQFAGMTPKVYARGLRGKDSVYDLRLC